MQRVSVLIRRAGMVRALSAAKKNRAPAANAGKKAQSVQNNMREGEEDRFLQDLKKHADEDHEEEDVFVDVDQLIAKYAALMQKSAEQYSKSADTLRIGNTDAGMFDHIKVKAYGDLMPFKSVAQAVVKSQSVVIVNVHDRSVSS